MYDGGAAQVPWAINEKNTEFARERGKIERFFALMQMKFKSFKRGHNTKKKEIFKRVKAALVLVMLDNCARIDVCRRQGKKLPKDLVTI
jgi:hypothetical protein